MLGIITKVNFKVIWNQYIYIVYWWNKVLLFQLPLPYCVFASSSGNSFPFRMLDTALQSIITDAECHKRHCVGITPHINQDLYGKSGISRSYIWYICWSWTDVAMSYASYFGTSVFQLWILTMNDKACVIIKIKKYKFENSPCMCIDQHQTMLNLLVLSPQLMKMKDQ